MCMKKDVIVQINVYKWVKHGFATTVQNPDHTPIENSCWKLRKWKVHWKFPSTKEDLLTAIQESWNHFNKEYYIISLTLVIDIFNSCGGHLEF